MTAGRALTAEVLAELRGAAIGHRNGWTTRPEFGQAVVEVIDELLACRPAVAGVDPLAGGRLRLGRRVPIHLYWQTGDAPADGDPAVGTVWVESIARAIVTAMDPVRRLAVVLPDPDDATAMRTLEVRARTIEDHTPEEFAEGRTAAAWVVMALAELADEADYRPEREARRRQRAGESPG